MCASAARRYFSDFSLTSGRVGKLQIDYRCVEKSGVAEITTRYTAMARTISASGRTDPGGRGCTGLIKSRVAVEDEATSAVIG